MRHSRQRDEILSLVRSGRLDHPTAQQIHDAARATMPELSLGTVYRNLRQLVEAGEIAVVPGDGPLHYDWNRSAHYHLRCRVCGALVDLPGGLARSVRRRAAALGHDLQEIDIQLRGTCARCLERDHPTT